MKTFILMALLASSLAHATNAVEAFHALIPYDDYVGYDAFGAKCEADVFAHGQGAQVVLYAPGRSDFIIDPNASFESTPRFFSTSQTHPGDDGHGTVELTLRVENKKLTITRILRLEGRQWSSALTCEVD